MLKSTFISIVSHILFILIAYYGLPSVKTNKIVEQPIDIVEDTPISSKTSLKLGSKILKENQKIKKNIIKPIIKKRVPPPPPVPDRKIIEKKNKKIKKLKQKKEIAELIKKKPKLKINANKIEVPKVISKPAIIKKKQNSKLAKGILNTLTKPQPITKKNKKDNRKAINQEVLNKIRQIVGNSSKLVQETDNEVSQTEIDKIKNHIGKCNTMFEGASKVKTLIKLKISTNMDGTVNNVRIFDKSLYEKNDSYRSAADSARRAVLECSPLPIPKNKSETFKNFYFTFDTSFIHGN